MQNRHTRSPMTHFLKNPNKESKTKRKTNMSFTIKEMDCWCSRTEKKDTN